MKRLEDQRHQTGQKQEERPAATTAIFFAFQLSFFVSLDSSIFEHRHISL